MLEKTLSIFVLFSVMNQAKKETLIRKLFFEFHPLFGNVFDLCKRNVRFLQFF